MTAPKWAQDLLVEACQWWQQTPTIAVALPTLDWRKSHGKRDSTGRTYYRKNRIVITAGSLRQGQRLTLLHEVAHFLTPEGEPHCAQFWDTAWALYRWADIPIRYAKVREGGYRKQALVAYKRSVRGR